MSAGAGSTPQGTAPTSAPPPAPNLTQSEVENRVAAAFMDSLDESNQEDGDQREKAEPEAPEADDASTEADAEADADEAEAEPDEGEAEEQADEDEEATAKPKKQPGDDVLIKMEDGSQVTLRSCGEVSSDSPTTRARPRRPPRSGRPPRPSAKPCQPSLNSKSRRSRSPPHSFGTRYRNLRIRRSFKQTLSSTFN
jgi:hypothetical protein